MHPAARAALAAAAVLVLASCGSNRYADALTPSPTADPASSEADQAAREACDEYFTSQIWEVVHEEDEKGDIIGSYAQPTEQGLDAVRSISAKAARAQELQREDGRYDGLAAAAAFLRDRLLGDRTEILDVDPAMETACREVPGWSRAG